MNRRKKTGVQRNGWVQRERERERERQREKERERERERKKERLKQKNEDRVETSNGRIFPATFKLPFGTHNFAALNADKTAASPAIGTMEELDALLLAGGDAVDELVSSLPATGEEYE